MSQENIREVTVEELVSAIDIVERCRRIELLPLKNLDLGMEDELEVMQDVAERREVLKRVREYFQGKIAEMVENA